MTDKLEALILDLRQKHGVTLSRDDPILILHSMNSQLIEDNKKATAQLLTQFREEIEATTAQWQDDAKDKAEKILNAALAASREVMTNTLHQGAKEALEAIHAAIGSAISEVRSRETTVQRCTKLTRLATGTMIALGFFITYALL